MKKFTLLLLSFLLFGTSNLQAQNWVNGGNNLTGTGRIGTNTEHALVFKTFNKERGRISADGLWGIGTATPSAKFHLNSVTGHNPLRVQVNNVTKLLAHTNGGASIGANTTPPTNGLYVSGSVSIGTTTHDPHDKLQVISTTIGGAGIHTQGESYGLRAIVTNPYGYGIFTRGGGQGIYAYGRIYGINAASSDGMGVWAQSTNYRAGSFSSENGTGLYATTYFGDYAAYFDGDTFAHGSYLSSDKNLKKNIQEVSNAMSILNKLKPYNYQFRDDGKFTSLHLPKGRHFGLLAQDVEAVLPELVKESAHEVRDHKPEAAMMSSDGKPSLPAIDKEPKESINIKAINYTELIPIVIKGMQELQQTNWEQSATIEKQAAQIAELTQLVNKLTQNINSTGTLKSIDTYLSQSTPNPNSNSTRITYRIPSTTAKAELVITNFAGQKVRQIPLNSTGLLDIDTSALSTGTYFYSLYLDGSLSETRKMMVNR